MKKIILLAAFFAPFALGGCATYNYAERVKIVGFSEDLHKGQSTGNVRGEDCTWNILGYQMGGAPTVDRAVQHAQNQTDGSSLEGSFKKTSHNQNSLRYIVNMGTQHDGFNAVLFGKNCIVVTGVGYK